MVNVPNGAEFWILKMIEMFIFLKKYNKKFFFLSAEANGANGATM